ncbi:alanine:cation symporter family protein [Candidatus Dependentiae bacterium]
MSIFYIAFAFLILFKDISSLKYAVMLVFKSAFSPAAAAGGFLGASVFTAMSQGIFKSVYSSEAGIGKAAIPHSLADVKNPTDQGILAIYGVVLDAFIALISGLLILITGVWKSGVVDSTMIYDVFKLYSPTLGRFVLMVSAGLFALTTVMGNSFDGSQSFASMTKHRWVWPYRVFILIAVFLGALVSMPIVWKLVDILVILIALPNVIGITILAFRKPEVLKV